jgi:hypothetical protein
MIYKQIHKTSNTTDAYGTVSSVFSRSEEGFHQLEHLLPHSGKFLGAGYMTHREKNKNDVDKYGHEAMEKSIADGSPSCSKTT